MAVVLNLRWAGVTPEQYDEVRDLVGWEETAPTGGRYHIAWFEDDGLHIVDVWDTPEQFQSFTDERLMAGVQKVGIETQPEVSFAPVHRVYDANSGKVIA